MSQLSIRRVWLGVLLACGIIVAPCARADIPPAYTIADVPVDATADNSISAKAAALSQGEAAAFGELMRRLTSAADASRVAAPGADVLTNLVADYQVSDERSSAVRYIARYTIRFNPRAVRDYLHGQGVAFTEFASKPVVIVPVLTLAGAPHLWDDPNPWRDAWNAQQGQSGLVPWIMPAGDIQDVGDFDLPNAANPGPDKLAALASRYGGGDVVIATAVETESGSAAHLAITLSRYPAGGSVQTSKTEISGDKADAAFYRSGVQAAAKSLETLWKAATFSAPSVADQTTELSVPISTIADWGRVQSRLVQIPIIHKVTVDFMARDEVRMSLTYAGDPDALKIAMSQQNLVLTDGNPYPTVAARAAADSGPPAPPKPE